jgi:5-methylcytosine-specific restriction endonuclease McrA
MVVGEIPAQPVSIFGSMKQRHLAKPVDARHPTRVCAILLSMDTKNTKHDHIALFGNVKMVRSWCLECECWAFVLDGKLACCDKRHTAEPKAYKRISEPEQARRMPSKVDRDLILQAQDYCCFYCGKAFNSYYRVYDSIEKLIIHWDHMVPYALTQNNNPSNFVAACQFCNHWKWSLVFNTVEEARVYLFDKWQVAGGSKTKEC